jgi:hypothetical protein
MKYGLALAAIATASLLTTPQVAKGLEDGSKVNQRPPTPSDLFETEKKDPLAIDVPCEDVSDAATKDACWRALRRRFEYFTSGMDHRTRVFNWQHFSSRVIFVFVLLLVSAGLAFSYMQFRIYLRTVARMKLPENPEDERKMATDLEISTGGVKVSSNVLGVIILALSLAFFYLYLVHVFPISDTF